jgi:hypothetical protein
VRLIRSILVELASARRLKAIHPNVALFAFFGMVHYTIKWYRPEGPVGLEELAESFSEIFTRGIFVSRPVEGLRSAAQKQGGDVP